MKQDGEKKLTLITPVADSHKDGLVELLAFNGRPLSFDELLGKAESGQLAKRPGSRSVLMKHVGLRQTIYLFRCHSRHHSHRD